MKLSFANSGSDPHRSAIEVDADHRRIPAGPGGEVGVQGGHGHRSEQDLGPAAAFTGHPQDPVPAVGAEIGHVCGAGLVAVQADRGGVVRDLE